MSSILHGEQGALSLSASLCHILRDPGAQNTPPTRHARKPVTSPPFDVHQGALGQARRCRSARSALLNELVGSPFVWKKLVGMQMLIEGLAMGAFASIWKDARDPLLRHLCQLVMTDEAFHHKFGKIWADRTIPYLSPEEHNPSKTGRHRCSWSCSTISAARSEGLDVQAVGLDPVWCQGAFMEAFTEADVRADMQDATNIFASSSRHC